MYIEVYTSSICQILSLLCALHKTKEIVVVESSFHECIFSSIINYNNVIASSSI